MKLNSLLTSFFITGTIFVGLSSCFSLPVSDPALLRPWNADWIAYPKDNGIEYGVYYFRKNIQLEEKPEHFIVHASADNHYKIFVNGMLVSVGPARGDIYYWKYETLDLAPYLQAGENNVTAQVWNEAEYRPEAQNSIRTAFILQGATEKEEVFNTNTTWKCIRDEGYKPLRSIFCASVGECVDMNRSVMGWHDEDLDVCTWPFASKIEAGNLKIRVNLSGLWMLVPSTVPPMELKEQRIHALRKIDGVHVPSSFPGKKSSITIPANSSVVMLLDQTYLTNAFLNLEFSEGKDAKISMRFAEAMFDEFTSYGAKKGNRNDVDGKIFYGRLDSISSNGLPDQSYATLYWRTFRYIQLNIRTYDEALILDDIYGTFIGYPYQRESAFRSENTEIEEMLDIGWRTARLCAMDIYWDCPYYEQLQYIGDTRIQAMISYYNTHDDRLARNALDLMDHSRLPEGVTLSRYPTKSVQIISTFSLWYIGMLHDYWMYRSDPEFIKEKLVGVRSILDFFGRYKQVDGTLKDLPYWNFVDWAGGDGWFIGAPPRGADGSSAIVDMQLLWAYQWASRMESVLGMPEYSDLYSHEAERLKESIIRKYWDSTRILFSDTKEKKYFSQHANSLAILTGLVKEKDMLSVCNSLLDDRSLTQCSLYFRYYLNQALCRGGLGDEYMSWLDDWRNSIRMGLSTWPEISNLEYTRSDCHAWSSSPNIEFYRTVLGIDSNSPGFTSVKIEPHLGNLEKVSGEIPHPKGNISVKYDNTGAHSIIEIILPSEISGIFIWEEERYELGGGENKFII